MANRATSIRTFFTIDDYLSSIFVYAYVYTYVLYIHTLVYCCRYSCKVKRLLRLYEYNLFAGCQLLYYTYWSIIYSNFWYCSIARPINTVYPIPMLQVRVTRLLKSNLRPSVETLDRGYIRYLIIGTFFLIFHLL